MRAILLTLLILCVYSSSAQADNHELELLATQDQADRAEKTGKWDDDARRRRVLELLATGLVVTAKDKLSAALILQHTPGIICDGRVKSVSPENYLLAHHLAKAAFSEGLEDAKHMVAQTIDRYLAFTEGRQRYGTTRLFDLKTGEEYFPYIDRSISDDERARYGVPPLSKLLKQVPERAPPESTNRATKDE